MGFDDLAREPVPDYLGLLGRLTAGPSTFEFFHRTPSSDELAACLIKHGQFRHFLSLRPDEHGRIAEALSQAGKQYTLTVFAGATHGFFCEDRSSYNKGASERSWRVTLAFFRDYLS
jgi:dienelactone hydrolase